MLFPTSIANSLIAVGTDGLQERDRMVRAAMAIICELGKSDTFLSRFSQIVVCLFFVSGCTEESSVWISTT